MISLIVSLMTHQKQWSFFERIDQIDRVLTNDFAIITPKKVSRTIVTGLLIFINVVLIILTLSSYFIMKSLGLPAVMVCMTYYVSNIPYSLLIMQFCFASNAISKRFFYINNIFRQLAVNDIPKVFDLCSRNERNERHTPTISLQEIYSIYGSYQMRKNVTTKGIDLVKDDFNREIRKLTTQLKKKDEGFVEQFKRRNLIEVEEFKIAKLIDTTADVTLDYLTKLVDLHDDLLDCISLQNQILSFQILLIISQIFVFGVITYFSLYRTANSSQSNILAYNNIMWIAMYNFILVSLMYSANQCTCEGKFTGTAVHKVINKLSGYNTVDARIIEKVRFMESGVEFSNSRKFW